MAPTLDGLVVRFYGYTQHFRPEEHFQLRAALKKALSREPGHALGSACLALLYEQEHSQLLNPLPEPHRRSLAAARRSVQPVKLAGGRWRRWHFFERVESGFRAATERVVALNPLNTTTMSLVGMLTAYAATGTAACSARSTSRRRSA